MHLEMSVSKIKANFTEMTSNTIYIVAFGVGFKCPRKLYLNTECVCGGGGDGCLPDSDGSGLMNVMLNAGPRNSVPRFAEI